LLDRARAGLGLQDVVAGGEIPILGAGDVARDADQATEAAKQQR